MIKTFLARSLGLIILAASKDVSLSNRLHYFLEALGKTAVALYLIDQINKWFLENHRFALFLCVALFANIVVGSTDIFRHTVSDRDMDSDKLKNLLRAKAGLRVNNNFS